MERKRDDGGRGEREMMEVEKREMMEVETDREKES